MKKKIFSLALALVLTLALVPMMSNPAIAAPTVINHTIANSSNSYLAIKNDGSLWSWGINADGTLGVGVEDNSNHPEPVKIIDDGVVSVYADFRAGYALKDNGDLYAWGRDVGYLTGTGEPKNVLTPTKLLDNVVQMSIGYRYAFAVKTDGSLWVWSTYASTDPVGYMGDNNVKPQKILDGAAMVTAYPSQSITEFMYMKTDGSVWKVFNKNSLNSPKKAMDNAKYIHRDLIIDTNNTLWVLDMYNDTTKCLDNVKYINDEYAIVGNGDLYLMRGYVSNILFKGPDYEVLQTNPFKTGVTDAAYATNALLLKPDGTVIVMADNGRSLETILTDVRLPSAAGTTPPVEQPPADPNTPSPWAEAPIASAIAKGFVPADLQTGYKNTITRLDFCRLAVKYMEYATGKTIDDILAEKGLQRDSAAFTDVTNSDVLAAYALGITSGAGAGIFNPSGQFTRESAAGMIMNLHRAMGKDVSNPPPSGFADAASISSWTKAGVDYCASIGIMSGGTGNMFNPKNLFTREMSIMLFDNMGL